MTRTKTSLVCTIAIALSATILAATATLADAPIFEETFSHNAYRPGMRIREVAEPPPGYAEPWRSGFGSPLRQQLQEGALEYTAANGRLANNGLFWWQRGRTSLNAVLDVSKDGPFGDYIDGYGWIGKPGKTLYMSFLMRSTGDDNRVATFALRAKRFEDDDTGGSRLQFVRTSEGQYEARIWPSGQYHPHEAPLGADNGEVNLFVVKFEFGAAPNGGDRVSIWRNPQQIGGAEPGAPTLMVDNPRSRRADEEPATLANIRRALGFDRLSLLATGGDGFVHFDALRFGPTWASVTPRQ